MSFSSFQTWLFDLDGTLIDSNSAVVACMKQTALEMGGEVTDEQVLRSSFGKGLTNTLKPWVPEGKLDQAIDRYMENFPEYVQKNLKFYEGVEELLQSLLEREIPMAIVTGNKISEAQGIYEQLRLERFIPFEVCVCADSIPFQKPSPEPVLEALKRINKVVHGAVFIGDSEHDIRAGRLAGVKTIAVKGGSSTEEQLLSAEPDWVLDSITDLCLKNF